MSWKGCKIYDNIGNFLALGEIFLVCMCTCACTAFFTSLFPGKSSHNHDLQLSLFLSCWLLPVPWWVLPSDSAYLKHWYLQISVWNFKMYWFIHQLEGTISSAALLRPHIFSVWRRLYGLGMSGAEILISCDNNTRKLSRFLCIMGIIK